MLTVLSMSLKKQQQHKEQFRSEILVAARELFSQEGYSNFSMRKLAAKIKYSPTTIYLYFRDKDDLLFCICEELYESFLNGIVEICATVSDPREALRLALRNYIEIGLSNPEHYKAVFFTSPVVYGAPHDFIKKDTMHLRAYHSFCGLVENCMKSGHLRRMDIETLVVVFWSAVHGLVTSMIFTRDFPLPDKTVVIDILVDGLLKGHAA